MKGKLNPREVRIDYTAIAEPLMTEQIQDDITEVQSKYMEQPDELVMWEHQWDWLVKPYLLKGRRSGWTQALQQIEIERVESHYPNTLFGVPVRFA